MDVGNQRRIQQLFGLLPELVAAFAFPLGIGNQRGDEFQNVFLTVDIGEWVVVHTLLEVDGIEYLDPIPLFQKRISALHYNGAFRDAVVKIENGNVTHFLR